jgi:hypothetical protein
MPVAVFKRQIVEVPGGDKRLQLGSGKDPQHHLYCDNIHLDVLAG